MNWNEYVQSCFNQGCYTGLDSDPVDKSFAIGPIGMMTEAGEVADHIKKLYWHKHPYTAEAADKLIDELGDVMWYIGSTLRYLPLMFAKYSAMSPQEIMDEILHHNLVKLSLRYPQGFTTKASINRTS